MSSGFVPPEYPFDKLAPLQALCEKHDGGMVDPSVGTPVDLSSIDEADAARALCLWSNTPGNPAGGLDDLAAVAEWGRSRGVPVLSDECYVEFTWSGPKQTVLQSGLDGVLAVHSVSKRS